MNTAVFRSLIILPLLSACTSSVEQTNPDLVEFSEGSTSITLKPPTWRLSSSVYDQDLGEYAVVNADTDWDGLSDSKATRDFLNSDLFKDSLSFVNKDFESTHSYSFELRQNGVLVATSRCEVLALNPDQKIVLSNNDISGSVSNFEKKKRQKTFLACAIMHREQEWSLTLESTKNQAINAQLKTSTSSYDIRDLSMKDGSRKVVNFYQNETQLTAFSLVGDSEILLKNDLSQDSQQLMLTANYSLAMLNWLDPYWRY